MVDKPKPLSLQVVERLADLVRTITIDNGFRTDIGKVVDTEPVQLDDATAFGAVVYVGGINPTDRSTQASIERRLEVVVDAYVGVDLDNAQALQHEVYDDIESLFSRGAVINVPGALPLEIGGATFLPRSDDMATAGVQIVVSTTYRPKAARK